MVLVDNKVNVLCLFKNVHQYVVIYRDDQSVAAFRAIARYAINPDLDFDLRDAIQLIKRHYQENEK